MFWGEWREWGSDLIFGGKTEEWRLMQLGKIDNIALIYDPILKYQIYLYPEAYQ